MRDIFHCVSTIILHILEKRNSNKALIRKHWHKTSREFIYSYMVIQQRSRWKPYITLPQRVERLKRRCASRRVFFCTALPRFMFVLISGSLKTKWKFVSAVSGSREGGLLPLQQKPGATCGAMAGTPGTHLGQLQGASGRQPKVQTLKWVHSDKAAVQVRVRSSDDDECQIQFHAHSDKCKVKLGLHSLGWGLHQQGPQPRHRHGCDGAAGGDCSGTAQAGTRDLGLSWNERSQLRLVRAVKPC